MGAKEKNLQEYSIENRIVPGYDGTFKINVDGTFNHDIGPHAFCVVIRDHEGQSNANNRVVTTQDYEEAKATTCLEVSD